MLAYLAAYNGHFAFIRMLYAGDFWATRMSLDAICKFFQIEADYKINAPAPASPIIHAKNHEEAILQIYNPVEDSTRLKNQPEQFETLRGDYPLRREETAYLIKY